MRFKTHAPRLRLWTKDTARLESEVMIKRADPMDSDSLFSGLWQSVRRFFAPPAWRGRRGRPKKHADREVLRAILFVLRQGLSWRGLQKTCWPFWQSVYARFAAWNRNGLWPRLNRALHKRLRRLLGRCPSPSAGAMDSQSAKGSAMNEAATSGFDAHKKVKGRKRHLLVDTEGLLVAVVVTAANIGDRAAARALFAAMEGHFVRLALIWVDGGYAGKEFIELCRQRFGRRVQVVDKLPGQKGFQPLPRRWPVERTFSWLQWSRRLSRDYERLPSSSEAFIYLASIHWSISRILRLS
jgi:putative transposase